MNLRKYSMDIEKLLVEDETLLRLLIYKPSNYLDNPLDTTKPNILDMPVDDMWKLIKDRVVSAPKFDDLDAGEEKCRLLFYPSNGRPQNDNYLYSTQQYTFDIFVHFNYQNIDKRLEWICDRVNELVFDKRITGMGKVAFKDRGKLSAPNNYLGYRLVYEFGSGNR